MKITVIDFDGTIFNTKAFVSDILEHISIDKQELYDRLDEYTDHDTVRALRADMKQYFFEGWEETLITLKNSSDSLILLTKALYSYRWQVEQISASGLSSYVDYIHITERNKRHDLEEFIKKTGTTQVVCINDSVSENAEIQEFLPQVEIVEIDHYSSGGLTLRELISDNKYL